jgi:hypothetical protein
VAGSSLFPDDPLTVLAILNSSAARMLLGAINPTVNFQVGDLAQLPISAARTASQSVRDDVARLIEHHRSSDRFDETTRDFVAPMPWAPRSISGMRRRGRSRSSSAAWMRK